MKKIYFKSAILCAAMLFCGNAMADEVHYYVSTTGSNDMSDPERGSAEKPFSNLTHPVHTVIIQGNQSKSNQYFIHFKGSYKIGARLDITGYDITFVGTGDTPADNVIDGSSNKQLFDIKGGAKITLKNLTLKDGNRGNANGSFSANASTLIADGCVFDNNVTACNANNLGGAIYAFSNSTVQVSNSTFSKNKAHKGGAIYVLNSNVTVENCVFDGNTTYLNTDAKDNSAFGGAIAVRNDSGEHSISITGSTFKNNVAWGCGGAVALTSGGSGTDKKLTANIISCSFVGNANGGFGYNDASTADKVQGYISGSQGGALLIEVNTPIDANIFGTTFANNTSATIGGALYTTNGGTLNLNAVNVTVSGNVNYDNNGNCAGFRLNNTAGTTKIVNSILEGNISKGNDNAQSSGGDLAISTKSIVTIKNSIIGNLNDNKYGDLAADDNNVKQTMTTNGTSEYLAAFKDTYFPLINGTDATTLGVIADATALGCTKDQFGETWTKTYVGAVQLVEGEAPTGISTATTEAKAADGAWYNINGIRVAQPTQRGLYIHNGKKVLVK